MSPHPEAGRLRRARTVLTAAAKRFTADELPDVAAALTYYAVLSLFPGLIALVSILGLAGQGGDALTSVVDQLARLGVLPPTAVAAAQPILDAISHTPAPGLGLAVGILGAVWSASNYVKAFGRAMNRVLGVREGRNAVKLNLQLFGLTAALLVLVAVALVLLAVSGPFTQALGTLLRLPGWLVGSFDYIKLPFLALVIVVAVGLLYRFTPDARPRRFRWLSVGALVAIGAAGVASAGFGWYMAGFGANSYDKTYGTLAGVIVFLVWLWIVNLALLFGGELDAELSGRPAKASEVEESEADASEPARQDDPDPAPEAMPAAEPQAKPASLPAVALTVAAVASISWAVTALAESRTARPPRAG